VGLLLIHFSLFTNGTSRRRPLQPPFASYLFSSPHLTSAFEKARSGEALFSASHYLTRGTRAEKKRTNTTDRCTCVHRRKWSFVEITRGKRTPFGVRFRPYIYFIGDSGRPMVTPTILGWFECEFYVISVLPVFAPS